MQDEGIVCPLGLQEGSRRCEEHPQDPWGKGRCPASADQTPDFGVRSGICRSVTWEAHHHHGDQPLLLDSVQRPVPHKNPTALTLAATRYRGRAQGQRESLEAGTVTSSFTLRGDCAGYHHPIQSQLDNWGLNSGKFKRQLRKGLILVKTFGMLALDDQGHQQ